MAVRKIHIEEFLGESQHSLLIDVRSPAEYNHAHIPGAINLPLFTDEERKVVGTTYKQESREKAIKIGLDYFGPKMKPMVEQIEKLCQLQTANCKLAIYCWRGGMRSAAVAWLMDLYGYKVSLLIGGYKKFRNYILDTFSTPFEFNIVGGYTGSGKTELIKALQQKGEKVIDLEELAKHKGSAFGNIGMQAQPTQELFENLLGLELRRQSSITNRETAESSHSQFTIHNSRIWLEDEAQRIGHVNIPTDLWKTMRESPNLFLDIPFEERLNHLVEEYGTLDKQKMIDAINRISEKLGGLNAKMAIAYLDEGNTIESFRILLKYYDKYYLKALHNRNNLNSLLQRIECKSVIPENASQLVHYSNNLTQKV